MEYVFFADFLHLRTFWVIGLWRKCGQIGPRSWGLGLNNRRNSFQPNPLPFVILYFTYFENQLFCSWHEYPSTLVPSWLTTAHPLLLLPPFHTLQIKLQYLHRRHQQYQPSSSDTIPALIKNWIDTSIVWRHTITVHCIRPYWIGVISTWTRVSHQIRSVAKISFPRDVWFVRSDVHVGFFHGNLEEKKLIFFLHCTV